MGQLRESVIREEELVRLEKVLHTLREADDVDALVTTALDYICHSFDYPLVWFGFYNRMEHRLLGKGGKIPSNDVNLLRQRINLTEDGLLEQVIIEQRSLKIPDLREERRLIEWRKVAQQFNIQGTVLLPIRYRDMCYGVVLLGTHLWGMTPPTDEQSCMSMVLGQMAAALHRVEADWQKRQSKHADEPLLHLLTQLRSLPSLHERLEAVIAETQKFVNPSRTSVYWYERERRYFWRRLVNTQKPAAKMTRTETTAGITVQDSGGFYDVLLRGELVIIGKSRSSLNSQDTTALINNMRVRSLLAAPIVFQNELFGFIAVEGTESRIWLDAEKTYLQGVANLLAPLCPLETIDNTIQRIKTDRALAAEIARAIYGDDDWREALKQCANQLCQRLNAERFVVLTFDQEYSKFDIAYQSNPSSRRPLPNPLPNLSPVDWEMVETSTVPIGIEDMEHDLKLLNWRQIFLDGGALSLLCCTTAIAHPLEAVLIVAHETNRSWSQDERELFRIVSQQIGIILHQWQLQQQYDQYQKNYQAVQWGITTIQQTSQLEMLDNAALQNIAQILHVPLVTLLTWTPAMRHATFASTVVNNPKFSINSNLELSVRTDPLIQSALQSDGLLSLHVDNLPAESRKWLTGSEIGQVLILLLRTAPEHEPAGMVLLADQANRQWTEQQLRDLGMLVSQLAWFRRYQILVDTIQGKQGNLERLNWYKQRRLEEIYRNINIGLHRLNEFAQKQAAMTELQYQQLLGQFGRAISSMTQLMRDHQWRLTASQEVTPLAGLLKRAISRADHLTQKRQIWLQVHNNEGNLNLTGDIAKIEAILYELIATACLRSASGSRIDIWCRMLDAQWLDLSITDNGVMDSRLLMELQNGRPVDLLAPSSLDQPPGLHLSICKILMQQMGGELSFHKLDDGRILSRLVLPLVATISSEITSGTTLQ